MAKVGVHVPEDIGSDLKVLPEGGYDARIKKFIPGLSKEKQPKLTARLTITSEAENPGDFDGTTVGETILDNFSLQPQAIWKLNDLYSMIVGERIPQGDWETVDAFAEFISDELIGADVRIQVETDEYEGKERSRITAYSA